MTALRIDSASKHYGDAVALDNVCVAFPDGVITAVIGPSGCGKSTLLKLCNGLIRPDQGQVSLFGEGIDYSNLPPLRRRMGYAVQGTALFPHLTARQNIELLAKLEHWSPGDTHERSEQLMALTRLEPTQMDRYPHQLSGGQQQRVGLCRAMMLRPEILLLDEPFAAIDPITREEIQRQLLTLHQAEPTTGVLVTHDMGEALILADHIVVMSGGRVLRAENRDALLRQYPHKQPQSLLRDLLAEAG